MGRGEGRGSSGVAAWSYPHPALRATFSRREKEMRTQRASHNRRMPDALSTFERVLKLSAFDGDSRAALRAMHAHFAHDLPDCTLALLLVRGQVEGRCRLAGLIGPDGTEHVPNLDPTGQRTTLPLFEDELAAD